ncbi:sugar ABC transporter permease [Devosia sp. YIM 151766]|uniref:carbohydrate ABC transporter permease n=1 Tax=Devosia sp. YIM 151766 TaxID=3017325 RepID=UPI00255D0007|nr:sugar ABC transporter permease [Devosia sp. YIM 151766]WIY53895.1 sugar ABC transporter permease [Devosia sp. YIM 151766]
MKKSALFNAVLFLAPAVIVFTLFVVMPMGEAGWYSFFNWSGYGRPESFVGFGNFVEAFGTPAFKIAVINVCWLIAAAVFIQIPLGLGMALLLANKLGGAVFFRLVFFLPYVLAQVAAGLIFSFVYDGDYGLLRPIFELFGMAAPYPLAEPDKALFAILFVTVWKYFGFHMMLMIAGLQSIDKSLIEAATIDGASRWQVTRFIVVPLLSPVLKLCIFFAVLGALQYFDLIMPLTGGGPLDATQTLVTYLYTHGITRMRIGYGSAIGVVLFLACVVFAFTYKKWILRDE